MKNISGLAIVLIIVAAGGGFYGGMKYQQSTVPIGGQFMMGQGGQRVRAQGGNAQTGGNTMRGTGGQGFRPVTGEIISADDTSITVKTEEGDSKIVVISSKTTINKSNDGSKADLKAGERVAVFGSSNSDGSVTAQSVQLNPQIRNIKVTGTPSK